MAQTRRTFEQLENIFRDGQADGSITAQDVRDLLTSLAPSTGSGYFTSPAVINISTIGAMTSPSSGTSAIIQATSDIDMPQNGRIRYNNTTDRIFIVTVSLTVTVVGNNQDLRFQLTRNGAALPETITGRSWGTGSDEGALSLNTGIILSPGDYIEMQAANDSSTNDITIVNGVIIMHGSIIS